jgi:hypothetical protein
LDWTDKSQLQNQLSSTTYDIKVCQHQQDSPRPFAQSSQLPHQKTKEQRVSENDKEHYADSSFYLFPMLPSFSALPAILQWSQLVRKPDIRPQKLIQGMRCSRQMHCRTEQDLPGLLTQPTGE